MFNFKHICAISLLLTAITPWTGSVQAEEATDSLEVQAMQPAREAADGIDTTDTGAITEETGEQTPEVTDTHPGAVVIPDVSTAQVVVEPVRVKSMQDDAEQALTRGSSQPDTSDRTLALLVLLGLGGFAFFLGRNRNKVAVQPSASLADPAMPDTQAQEADIAEITDTGLEAVEPVVESVVEPVVTEAEAGVSAAEPTAEATLPADSEIESPQPEPVGEAVEDVEAGEDGAGENDETESLDDTPSSAGAEPARASVKTRPHKRGRGR